ncbi:hypothetical protein F0562_015164 [Nyssa sinensis]|uniref:Bulb-type lectin domain-containing protein n=1 Tax=Nyssa sinensis TaxID=561372 RepID=A0A5J4ZGM0_9ASTE|nr:hypothetical protein F0562_015164 [Nyssa sinensis]
MSSKCENIVCNSLIKLSFFVFLIHFFIHGHCYSDIHTPYRVTLAVPVEYSMSFIGRAFLMETNQTLPNFRAALSVEALNQNYSCSLDVLFGDVKVWSSGHLSPFYTTEKCVLELTQDGDLQLKDKKEQVGWRTGTHGQGVERLQLLRTGNLVLVDALNLIKWQSFNFPTNVMLWGQRLDVATHLTSFPTNSTSFYSFEIQDNKIALYLNSGKLKYSYWEFKPSKNRNITFVKLGSKGLVIFNDKQRKIAQIPSQRHESLQFLALSNRTGNMGLYYYSPNDGKFKSSFQALNSTCDLPLACKPYGICTLSNVCSCIRFVNSDDKLNPGCSTEGNPGGFCGESQAEMLELHGVTSVLRVNPNKVNVSKDVCANLCMDDCKCVAALYSSGKECFLYELVRGVKQVDRELGMRSSYMVKVPKGTSGGEKKSSGLRKWVLILVGVVDGLIIFLVLGAIGYYVIWRRRKNSLDTDNT